MRDNSVFEGLSIEEEILKLTEDLVRFKTVKGNSEEFEKAFEYIQSYFEGSQLEVFEHEFSGFKTMIFATEEDPEVLLHGHIDVVAADESMFNPTIKYGKIYGRGTADMKSGVASLMTVLKNTSHSSVGLMIVSDEEIGGFNGAKPLSEEYSPNFVISAEPNNTDKYMEIITEQKGVIRAEIMAEGENAHGSRPWNGENAAEKLWEKYVELKQNFCNEPTEWETTVNLGNFTSEGAANVVPDKASAQLDIRYTNNYGPEEIEEDMKKIKGLKYNLNAVDPMLHTDSDNHYVQKLIQASQEIINDNVVVGRKEPASDVRHFSEKNIPGVVFGPEGYHVHEDGEYAVINSFEDYYHSINQFLEKLT